MENHIGPAVSDTFQMDGLTSLLLYKDIFQIWYFSRQLMLESEFLKIVKGYCVLEPIIRNECIQPVSMHFFNMI